MIGQLIADRYLLEEPLGVGGMAQVFRGNDVLLNRAVTVKILKQEFSGDEEFILNFNHEAKSAASINHPNVVSVYDVGEENGLHYIVMEYIDGIDVQELIDKNGPIAWQYAVDIYLQVGLAIENAHQHSLIHRDIKPKNILLTREGKIKVTDFGIAIAMNSSTINLSTTNMGSVHYFSPEQAQGRPVDERSDIYSMGISMYETLTGKLPFDGDNPVSIALMHIKEAPVAPFYLNDQIPQGLNDIVMKCIEKNPKNRYQSVGELLDDIRAIMDDPAYDIAFIPAGQAPEETETPKQKTKTKAEKKKVDEDDPGEGHKSYFLSNFTKILIALTILFALGTSVYYVVAQVILPVLTTSPKEIYVVQDFTGKKYSEVVEELNNIGVFTDPTYEYSTEVAEGYIIRQETPVGEQITKNSNLVRVKFVVSRGPQYVQIPDNLEGKDKREVENILNGLGLQVTFDETFSDTVAIGYVAATYPEMGTNAIYGTNVFVYVSKGPSNEKIVVPDITGFSQRAAYTELIKAGLKVGTVSPDPSDYVDYTVVVDYTVPAIGEEVDAGTAVDIYLKLIKNEHGSNDKTEDVTEGGDKTDDLKPDFTKYLKQSRKYTVNYEGTYAPAQGINVKIVAVVKGETTEYVVSNDNYRLSQFPLEITVDLPFVMDKETFVTIYVDGENYADFGETFEKVVPDCIGQSVADTVALLNQLEVKIEYVYDYSDTYEADTVIDVNPGVGTEVKKGDKVVITVSLGKKIYVPNVVGMTYNDAVKALTNAGLTLGTIAKNGTGAFYSTVASANPEVGSGIAAGAAVNLTFNTVDATTINTSVYLKKPDNALTSDKVLVQITVVTADGTIAQEIYNVQLMAYQMNSNISLDIPVTTGDSRIYIYYDGELVNTVTEEYTPPVVTEPPVENTEDVPPEQTQDVPPEDTQDVPPEQTQGGSEPTQDVTPEETQDASTPAASQTEVTE
ncbi:MAG: Stk1 family PASTA domain-containing Ser/Thr kinase [Clostridia bacterium]|nr:Stk1 family PASTA domain-containing Ser/Thr kinase [Clostridia bacterium]